jgi:excinuclease ABC subunit B
MYADRLTDSMEKAIGETHRRRLLQQEHNQKHGIEPTSIVKQSSSNAILDFLSVSRRLNEQPLEYAVGDSVNISLDDIPELIQQLEMQMQEAAKKQEFEQAAKYRDRIKKLRDRLVGRSSRL